MNMLSIKAELARAVEINVNVLIDHLMARCAPRGAAIKQYNVLISN